jgi:hypothetical protein
MVLKNLACTFICNGQLGFNILCSWGILKLAIKTITSSSRMRNYLTPFGAIMTRKV